MQLHYSLTNAAHVQPITIAIKVLARRRFNKVLPRLLVLQGALLQDAHCTEVRIAGVLIAQIVLQQNRQHL